MCRPVQPDAACPSPAPLSITNDLIPLMLPIRRRDLFDPTVAEIVLLQSA